MISFAALAAVATVAAAVLAVHARDGRAVASGLALAMIAAPLAASPEPGLLALAARLAGALLAADLIWVATRTRGIRGDGSIFGLPAVATLAAAAFLVGLWIGPVTPLPGPIATQAAGLALVVLALAPLAGRDALRVGTGAALMCLGLSLLNRAWLGPGPALEDLLLAVLLVGILGATAMLSAPRREPAVEAATEPADESLVLDSQPSPARALPAPVERSWDPWKPDSAVQRRYAGAHPDLRRTRHPRDQGPAK